MSVPSTALFGELVLMVDVFAACIETGIMPTHGSPCHRKARQLVDKIGMKPKRKRRRLSPNASLSIPGGEPGYAPGDC
jgi:hypothetical protein